MMGVDPMSENEVSESILFLRIFTFLKKSRVPTPVAPLPSGAFRHVAASLTELMALSDKDVLWRMRDGKWEEMLRVSSLLLFVFVCFYFVLFCFVLFCLFVVLFLPLHFPYLSGNNVVSNWTRIWSSDQF